MGQDYDYGAVAQRVIEAQAAFRQIYEQTHPYPVAPQARAQRDWFGRAALWAVMVAAVIVSGSHTVTVFSIGKTGVVGGAAFVMLEVGLFIFSFVYTRDTYRSRDDVQVLGYLKRGMQVTFFVLLSGNVSDVMQNNGFATGQLWVVVSFVVSMSVALSAPIVAWIVGHTLAMLLVQDGALDRKAQSDYDKAKSEWTEEFMHVWNANKARWNANVNITVAREALPVQLVRPVLSERTVDSGQGYRRDSNASKTVHEYLDANPDAIGLPVRELAERIGVGKSTVAKVLAEKKEMSK